MYRKRGRGTARSKRKRQDRKRADIRDKLYQASQNSKIQFTSKAKAQIDSGFTSEDAFDAMVGVLSIIRVVKGDMPHGIPDDPAVRNIEGWILGQAY